MSAQRDQLAATLREVLASFTEVKSIAGPARVLAYNGHVVSPDVFARWRSVLDEFDAPSGTTHSDPFLSPWQTNPTAGTPEDAAAQLNMAGDLDRALKARHEDEDAYADVDRLARDVRDALCEDVPATGYDRDVVEKFDRLLAAVRHEHGERIAKDQPFQHVPRCHCATYGAPYDNERDPRCMEWDKIARRSVRDLDRALKDKDEDHP